MLPIFRNDEGSNFTNPPTRAKVIVAAILPLYSLTLAVVCARFVVKTKLHKLGIDDLLIGVSMTLALAVVGCTLTTIKYGFGMHAEDFRPEWWLPYGKIFFAGLAISSPCVFITKTSMVFFYLSLAPHPTFRHICHLSIAITTALWSAIFLINVFGCAPLSGAWDRSGPVPPKCITDVWFYRFAATSNLATDVMVMALPVPILLQMQLSLKTRLGLVVMFSMGFTTTVMSAMCLHSVSVMIASTDMTWDGAYTWLWALLEVSTGIMTACMPAMTLFWRWIKGEYSGAGGAGGAGGAVGNGESAASTIGGGRHKGLGNGKGKGKGRVLDSADSGSVVLRDLEGGV